MPDFSVDDYASGKVICDSCHNPIYDPTKAMVHYPTARVFHEELCFGKAFSERFGAEIPPDVMKTIESLFGIEGRDETKEQK